MLKTVERGASQLDTLAAIRHVMPSLPPAQSKPAYTAVNVLELANHTFKPREAILAPWLLTQSLNMIYAWRGVGKTHVALGVAFAVAAGGEFLKWKAAKARKVLYLDGEMPGASLQSRILALIANSEADFDPDNFRILTPDLQEGVMPDICTPEGQLAVEDLIKDAEVIVVDNLSSLARSGGNENSTESVEAVSGWALRMRQEGRSVIFVHHSGKNGVQRGTSKREDVLDVVISLKRPKDYQPSEGAKFEVHFEKGRDLQGEDAEPFEVALVAGDNNSQAWEISGILKFPQKLKPEQKTALANSWNTQYSGGANAGKTALLEEGVEYQTISMTLEDAEWIEARKFSVHEIARLFRVPPVIIQAMESANYSNSVELFRQFATLTLRRHLTMWEQAISKQLLTEAGRRAYHAEHSVEGLLRGDSNNRADFYGKGLTDGWLTIEEVRQLENLPKLPNAASTQTAPAKPAEDEAASTDQESQNAIAPQRGVGKAAQTGTD